MDVRRLDAPKEASRLIHALADDSSKVREAAAKALGTMGDPRAVDPLIAALGDPLDSVREAAAAALERLGEPLAG